MLKFPIQFGIESAGSRVCAKRYLPTLDSPVHLRPFALAADFVANSISTAKTKNHILFTFHSVLFDARQSKVFQVLPTLRSSYAFYEVCCSLINLSSHFLPPIRSTSFPLAPS